MAKGSLAKNNVAVKLRDIYGEKNFFVKDKKIYIMETDEDNERVQICISMTCPKQIVQAESQSQETSSEPAQDKIDELMKKLGI